jgi:molecular chaperone HscB
VRLRGELLRLTCWNCQKDPGPEAFCVHCGKLQPLAPSTTLYGVLGLSPESPIDSSSLEKRFHERSRRFHPDRFAKASPTERRIAAEWTVVLNEAYRRLGDPAERATYLLGLHGVQVDKASTRMAPEFLEEMLEKREALAKTRKDGDLSLARKMAVQFRERAMSLQTQVDGLLFDWHVSKNAQLLEEAAAKLASLKYVRRFLDEVEAMEAEDVP